MEERMNGLWEQIIEESEGATAFLIRCGHRNHDHTAAVTACMEHKSCNVDGKKGEVAGLAFNFSLF